jgi:uncharacterized coiled-coil protein SlyX
MEKSIEQQLEALVIFNHETIELLNLVIQSQKDHICKLNQTCKDSTETILKMSLVIGDQRARIEMMKEKMRGLRRGQYVSNDN